MKRVLSFALFACASAWGWAAHAANTLPDRLAGSWGTSASLFDGDTAQSMLHLAVDGYGLMAGSAAPPKPIIDGRTDASHTPRAVIGFPVHATLDGDTLTLQPFLPEGAPAEQAAKAARIVITCRYEASGPALTCMGPDGTVNAMRRLGATLAPEVAATIESVKPRSGKP
jgi:hypothetical protein